MGLGNNLFNARKKKALSQEYVAEKLGVSRQTVSKWETDDALPDINQAKKMSLLYGVTLDELLEYDIELKEIQDIIQRTSDELTDKIDWNKAWGKKYPILLKYQQEVNIPYFAEKLELLLRDIEKMYGYNEMDSFLVLKDILAAIWNQRKVQ